MARRVESVGGGRDVTRRRRHNSLAWGALRGAVLVALSLAAGAGFLWGEGAWCRALCPIGLAGGILAAAAPLALHADAAGCRGCREKPCRGACPTGEFAGRAAFRRPCTLCLACVPACPSGSLALRGRWPGRELLRARPELSAALMGVAIVGIRRLWM